MGFDHYSELLDAVNCFAQSGRGGFSTGGKATFDGEVIGGRDPSDAIYLWFERQKKKIAEAEQIKKETGEKSVSDREQISQKEFMLAIDLMLKKRMFLRPERTSDGWDLDFLNGKFHSSGKCPKKLIVHWYRSETKPSAQEIGEFLSRDDVRKFRGEHWYVVVGREGEHERNYRDDDHDTAIIKAIQGEKSRNGAN